MLVTCIGLGAMFSLGIFMKPMSEAMGWSRTGISAVATLNFICMGVGSLAWGALSDRFGTRAIVLTGGALLGLGIVGASQAPTLGWFQLLFGPLVGFAGGSFYAPLTASVMRWFTRHRSLAVALVSAGIGVGSLVVGPIARSLITAYDWRVAMLTIGVLAWLVVIPAALLIRNPPSADGKTAPAPGMHGREYTVGEALRTPQFAAIALTHFACCATHSGPIFHMVANAMDHGVAAMAAATVIGVAGVSGLCGRVLCGLLADRFGAKRILVIGLTVQAVCVSLYLFTHHVASFYALAVLFGLAYGGVMPLYAILVREYFGERIMGTVFGAVALASTLGMALGPWAGGWLYDTFGSYFWLYVGSFGVGLGAVAIAATFRPPRAPAVALPSPSAAR
jgi:MFS family permease